jgi:NitT/TauT family transport system ATP-binding protein/sulfonate transport system ATP-binding protein
MNKAKNTAKIVAKNVRKTFRTKTGHFTALESFDLDIDEGQFMCILGPSGCGKSTFLRMVAGLTEPSGGTITMDGKPIEGPHPDRGLVFQEYALFPWLSVMQNVMYGPLVRGVDRKRAEDIARQQITRVGLSGFENYFPRQLSGGMKQRVGIARVWANEPQVMLMDEPFGALDNITRGILQKDLLKLWLEERKTVLFITHSVEEAIYLADTIIVMSSRPGRIVSSIKVSEARPRNLLGAEAMALRAELSDLVEHQVMPTP